AEDGERRDGDARREGVPPRGDFRGHPPQVEAQRRGGPGRTRPRRGAFRPGELPRRGAAGVDLEMEVTRAEFEQAVGPLLDRARDCLRKALAAKQLKPSAVDRVLLVGGTTYVPCVRELVASVFGKEPRADVN